MVMHAVQSIAAGMAEVVACVFADAPLKPPARGPAAKASGGSAAAYGYGRNLEAAYGLFGVNATYAFVARRHMYLYGTTGDQLGAIATAQRAWANLNPDAQMYGQPMTMDDYHSSRWVVEPFHLYDCCLVSNGGLAVIVTSAGACSGPEEAAGLHPRYGSGTPRRRSTGDPYLGRADRQGNRVPNGGRQA